MAINQDAVSVRNKRSRGRGRYGEQRLAKLWQGVVVGRSKAVQLPSKRWIAIDCQHPCDVVNDWAGFESKWLKKAPAYLAKVMAQAIRNCPENLTPIGVIGDRESHEVFYIIMEKDMIALHGNEKEKE